MDHVCFLSFLPHNIYCTFLLCVLTGHTHTHPLLYAIKNVCPRSTKTVIAKNETETRCKALSLSLIHKNRNYLDLYRFATIKLILSHTQLCFKRNASPLPPSTSRKKTTTPVTLPRHREECNFFKLTKGTRRALYRYTHTHMVSSRHVNCGRNRPRTRTVRSLRAPLPSSRHSLGRVGIYACVCIRQRTAAVRER